jgi:hypothetical protein
MTLSTETKKELDRLFSESINSREKKAEAFRALASLIQSFEDNPTAVTGKSVGIAMGTYAIAFNQHSIAAEEYGEAVMESLETLRV